MKTFQLSSLVLGSALYVRYASALGFTLQLYDADDNLKDTISANGTPEEMGLANQCQNFPMNDDGTYPTITKLVMQVDVDEYDKQDDWTKLPSIAALYTQDTECMDNPSWGPEGYNAAMFPAVIVDTIGSDLIPEVRYELDLTQAPTLESSAYGVNLTGTFTNFMFVYDLLENAYWTATMPQEVVEVANGTLDVSNDPDAFEAQEAELEVELDESPFANRFISFNDNTGDESGDAVEEITIDEPVEEVIVGQPTINAVVQNDQDEIYQRKQIMQNQQEEINKLEDQIDTLDTISDEQVAQDVYNGGHPVVVA